MSKFSNDEFFTQMEGNPANKVQAISSLMGEEDVLNQVFDSLLWYLKKRTKDFKEGNL